MKKIVTPLLFALGLINQVNAQTQLPNVGFENWQNVGTNTEEPTNWSSNETGGGFATWGPQTCFRSTTAHSGTYSAELRTLSYLGNAVNGSITTGKIQAPSTTPSQGYIETVRTDPNFNAPFTGRPDSLVGYFMYTQAGSDQGKVEVILHGDYNVRTPADANSVAYTIGTATFLGPQANVGTWTRFSVPFNYVSQLTPMYALAVATSSSTQPTAVNGSKMWIDDLQVIYNPPTISITSITPSYSSFCVYSTGYDISVPFTTTGTFNSGNIFTLELSDATGSFLSPTAIGSFASTTDGTINGTIPAGTPSGNAYRLRIVSSNPSAISPINSTALTVKTPTSGIDVITACDTYTWINNVTYTSSNNTATRVLTNAAGCDSVVTLNLTIKSNTTGTDVISACDTYTWIDNITYSSSNNTATHTLPNAAGCDSVVTLNLTIKSNTTGTDIISACDTYTWIDNVTYTSNNNTATHTLSNVAGCDSIVTLNLTIKSSTTGTDVISACDTYTWIDNVTYTSSNNTATHTLSNVAGCDSIVTLNLTINSIDNSVTQNGNTLTANMNGASYQWIDCNNGNTPISSETNQSFTALNNGDYAVEITANNCTETSTCFNISLTSINSDQDHLFTIHPNPAAEQISISTKKQLSGSSYLITNTIGEIVLKGTIDNDYTVINISELPQGVYFFTISNERAKATKIIKH